MFRLLDRSLSMTFLLSQLEAAAADLGSRNLFDGFVYMEICFAVASELWMDGERQGRDSSAGIGA